MSVSADLTYSDPVPGDGLVDIHSHLLPGIDDGCQNLEQSLDAIRQLKRRGFVGSICTPHIWPDAYPGNTTEAIAGYVSELRDELKRRDIDYQLWAGGELRLRADTFDWLDQHGTPALAGSRYLLVDMWEDAWQPWMDASLDTLAQRGWRVILAHPERLNVPNLDEHLQRWLERGVLLQGNFRSLVGREGERAESRLRQWIGRDWITFLSLDMHAPDSLAERLAGVDRAVADFGFERVQQWAGRAALQILTDACA